MKVIKILLIAVGALVILALLAVFIFIKTFDINRYKPQIISQAEAVLGRKVNFDKAQLAFSPAQGLSLKVDNFLIAEDPAFGKGDFLTVKSISLGVDVGSYLSRKEVAVSDILIDAPQAVIIRQKDGSLNVTSLAKAGSTQQPKPAGLPASSKPVEVAALPALFISSVAVSNGTLTYVDHSFSPPINLKISSLSLKTDKISFTQPFTFVLEGAVLSDKKNVRLEGRAQINTSSGSVTLMDLKATSDLSSILLGQIPASLPMAPADALPTQMQGNLDATAQDIMVGPEGLSELNADVRVTRGLLAFKQLAAPVKDISMNAKVLLTGIRVDHASAALAGGAIKATGAVDDYIAKQIFNADLVFENVNVQDLVSLEKSPVKVEGALSGKMNLKGQGFNPQAISTLSGEGNVSSKLITLKDLNVLRVVLDKISVIPNLGEDLQNRLPERYKQRLTEKDTVLSDIDVPLAINQGRVVANALSLTADDFTFKGRLDAAFDGAMAAEGSLFVTRELSAAMTEGAPQLQYLQNMDKQIEIPVKVSAKAGGMDFKPDLEYIGKKLLITQMQTQATEQLTRVINKALGIEEPSQGATTAASQGATTAASQGATTAVSEGATTAGEQPSPTQELVSGILETIFSNNSSQEQPVDSQ